MSYIKIFASYSAWNSDIYDMDIKTEFFYEVDE